MRHLILYFFVVLFFVSLTTLFLAGCASMSDYKQGCYDGLDEMHTYKEHHKQVVCSHLEQKRLERIRQVQEMQRDMERTRGKFR